MPDMRTNDDCLLSAVKPCVNLLESD